MFYCFPNEIQLPGTQSFSIFGSGRVGYLKKSSGRVGYRDPVGPCSLTDRLDGSSRQSVCEPYNLEAFNSQDYPYTKSDQGFHNLEHTT